MCGIFGWADASCSKAERTAMATILALENDTRGGDSWGYWTPGEEPVKGVGKLATNVPSPTFSRMRTVLAHTRFATQGIVNKRNAHPFRYGSVTGAHNGVIWNSYDLDIEYPLRDCEVDSEHLIQHIAERLPLTDVEGYGAVEYTDTLTPGVVYLGRFNGGELAAAVLKKGGVVWSSSREHLIRALVIAGVEFRLLTLAEGRLYSIEHGVLKRYGKLDCGGKWESTGYCGYSSISQHVRRTYKVRTRGKNKYRAPSYIRGAYPELDYDNEMGTGSSMAEMRMVNEYLAQKDRAKNGQGYAKDYHLPAPAWETEEDDLGEVEDVQEELDFAEDSNELDGDEMEVVFDAAFEDDDADERYAG